MFIRRSATRNTTTGESYFTYRLVRTERVGGKVRQITLLNLGREFAVPQENWPVLCLCIEQLISAQDTLLAAKCSERIEAAAQRYAGQLVMRAPTIEGSAAAPAPDFREVDVDSVEDRQPRSVGVEHVGLAAMSKLGFVEKLKELGLNGASRAAVIGNVIGRMAKPASELATWKWLQRESGLGELIDVNFQAMSLMRLYRASDALVKHRAGIEDHLFARLRTLFALEETVTLYDLTNTYFEGQCAGNKKAALGRSKEKRSDCPLVTLGLVLDGSGFVRRSRLFGGNATEAHTLEKMLRDLGARENALVICDAGIATADNLSWLIANTYRYLAVSREQHRQFDAHEATALESAGGETIRVHKVLSDDGQEVRLYCHSTGREKKEVAIVGRFVERFEKGLAKLELGLAKPRGEKRYDKIMERIGRLKEKSHGLGQHYQITVQPDQLDKKVSSFTWCKTPNPGSMLTDPGVYCLRTNELTWNAEKLWRTYIMLTDLEAVFRSLKSELGLRPVYHSKEERTDGHLFISVLAYQFVQFLRAHLKAQGIHDSWSTLRETLTIQRRTTTSFRQRDARTLHVRKTSAPEPDLQNIYSVLGLDPKPGGIKKLVT
jgi:transposase